MMESITSIESQIEYLNKQSIPSLGITFGMYNNDFNNWRVTMMAPADTSYKGGLFYLSIHFPQTFPLMPPEVCFLTPIYHINVNPFYPCNQGAKPLGYIPIESLGFWNPYCSIKELFLSIYSLFYYGNLAFPYGSEKTNEYKNDRALYEEKIKYFTRKYANASSRNNSSAFQRNNSWDFTFNIYDI